MNTFTEEEKQKIDKIAYDLLMKEYPGFYSGGPIDIEKESAATADYLYSIAEAMVLRSRKINVALRSL